MRRVLLLTAILMGLSLCASAQNASNCSNTSLSNGYTCVEGGHANSGGSPCAVTGMTLTAGDFVIAWASSNNTNPTLTVSDSAAEATWSTPVARFSYDSTWYNIVFLGIVNTSGASTINIATSNTANFINCQAMEFSGPAGTVSADQNANNYNSVTTTSPVTGTTGTTAQATELLITMWSLICTSCTMTAGSGYTLVDQTSQAANQNNMMQAGTVTSTGTYQGTATLSLTGTGDGIILTIKTSSSGPPPNQFPRVSKANSPASPRHGRIPLPAAPMNGGG